MAVLGRKATPHVFYLCDVSQSLQAGSIWRLSKKLHLFPRKWARHRHPLLVCGQRSSSQWAGMQLSTSTCDAAAPSSNSTTSHSAWFCAQLCVRQLVCTRQAASVLCITEEHWLAVCAQRAPPGSREQAG